MNGMAKKQSKKALCSLFSKPPATFKNTNEIKRWQFKTAKKNNNVVIQSVDCTYREAKDLPRLKEILA